MAEQKKMPVMYRVDLTADDAYYVRRIIKAERRRLTHELDRTNKRVKIDAKHRALFEAKIRAYDSLILQLPDLPKI